MAVRHDLRAQRKVTSGFIATQPVAVILTRRTRVKKPAGGWAWEDNFPVPVQTMRIVEPSALNRPTVTADGVERVVDYMLLGEWDADVQVGDTFVYQGKDFEVLEMAHDNGYEQRALVAGRG